jgi:WD40 repeat protein
LVTLQTYIVILLSEAPVIIHVHISQKMSGLFSSASAAPTNTIGDLKNDVPLGNSPEDSISDLAFNPSVTDQKDFLAVASWDRKVRIYEILTNGQAEGRHLYEHDGPVLSCDWFKVIAATASWHSTRDGEGGG